MLQSYQLPKIYWNSKRLGSKEGCVRRKITIVSGMNLRGKEEHLPLKDLSTNKDLIIQESDKGNSVVSLNSNDYIKRMTKFYRIFS